METKTLEDYFEVAFGIQFLRRPQGAKADYVVDAIDSLLCRLPDNGFVHAAEQAVPLKRFRENLRAAAIQSANVFVRGMPDNWIHELSKLMEPIVRNVASEGRQIVLTRVDQSAVSLRLREFGKEKLTDEQEAIKAEAIRCLEIGACRAAMVMGWNLVFDLVRRWIFDNKLSEFNVVLTSKNRKKNILHSRITDYSEFFVLQERDVLDWSFQASLFNEKVHRALVERLDRRNDYAHPNFKNPDPTQVNGYVNEILTIIEDTPFSFGQ